MASTAVTVYGHSYPSFHVSVSDMDDGHCLVSVGPTKYQRELALFMTDDQLAMFSLRLDEYLAEVELTDDKD